MPTIVQSKFGSSQRVGAAPVRLLGTRLRATGWHAGVRSNRSGVGMARAGLEAPRIGSDASPDDDTQIAGFGPLYHASATARYFLRLSGVLISSPALVPGFKMV